MDVYCPKGWTSLHLATICVRVTMPTSWQKWTVIKPKADVIFLSGKFMISKSTIVSRLILYLLFIHLFNRILKLFEDWEVIFVLKQLPLEIITHEITNADALLSGRLKSCTVTSTPRTHICPLKSFKSETCSTLHLYTSINSQLRELVI